MLWFSSWAIAELIEAATRSGMPERAGGTLARLSETARASGTDWALGIEARTRALVSEGEKAETLYREALNRTARREARVRWPAPTEPTTSDAYRPCSRR